MKMVTKALSFLVLLVLALPAFAAGAVSDVQMLNLPAPGKCSSVVGRMLCADKSDGTRLSLVTVSSSGEGTMQSVSLPPSGKCGRDDRLMVCLPEEGRLMIIPNLQ